MNPSFKEATAYIVPLYLGSERDSSPDPVVLVYSCVTEQVHMQESNARMLNLYVSSLY